MKIKRVVNRLARHYAGADFYLRLPLGLILQLIRILNYIYALSKKLKKEYKLFFKNNKILKKTQAKSHKLRVNVVHNIRRNWIKSFNVFKPFWRKTKKRKKHILAFLVLIFFVFGTWAVIFFFQDLPSPRMLKTRQIPQTTKIYDRNGTLLYQIYANQNRTLIPLRDIPRSLQMATLAIEDKNFYNHPGFDLSSIMRAALSNAEGKGVQGGSTLTQQLVKSSLLYPERSIMRKVKEVVLSFWAERLYTKQEILTMYFNQIPYGGTAWGAEAAAEVYFNKQARNLSLPESAFLAGITSAPTTYSPYVINSRWKERQREVLTRMLSLKMITPQEKQAAEKTELHFAQPQTPLIAPHFVMYVRDLLVKQYGLAAVERGGLRVYTTLDLSLQKQAEEIVKTEVANSSYLNLTNGAALVTNPRTGDILAMVGSKDYFTPGFGTVNLTSSLRQPGSSIKVVTYAAALEQGLTAATVIRDEPTTFLMPGAPPYTPVNYDERFHGRVPIRIALGNSFNIPAVKTLQRVGISNMVNLGREMGIKSWGSADQYGLAITLGAAETTMLDMATVFGTLANLGARVDLNPILRLTNSRGKVLEEKHPAMKQVLKAGVSYIMSDMLADPQARLIEFGPNTPLSIPGHTVSVKTGTSDNKRDNWTIGYTPDFVVASWVGNNDNSPMSQSLTSGITGAAPIWNQIMQLLLKNRPDHVVKPPGEIVQRLCNGRPEYFLQGSENTANCINLPTTAGYSLKRY